jgi:hypothetical protein
MSEASDSDRMVSPRHSGAIDGGLRDVAVAGSAGERYYDRPLALPADMDFAECDTDGGEPYSELDGR